MLRSPEPLTATQVAERTGYTTRTVRKRLGFLIEHGLAGAAGHHTYRALNSDLDALAAKLGVDRQAAARRRRSEQQRAALGRWMLLRRAEAIGVEYHDLARVFEALNSRQAVNRLTGEVVAIPSIEPRDLELSAAGDQTNEVLHPAFSGRPGEWVAVEVDDDGRVSTSSPTEAELALVDAALGKGSPTDRASPPLTAVFPEEVFA